MPPVSLHGAHHDPLKRRGGPFVVNPSGSTYSYFMSTLDPVAQALVPKMLLLDNSDEGAPGADFASALHQPARQLMPMFMRAGEAAVAAGDALAYLTDYSTLQYYQTQLNCKLVVRLSCAIQAGVMRRWCNAINLTGCRWLVIHLALAIWRLASVKAAPTRPL